MDRVKIILSRLYAIFCGLLAAVGIISIIAILFGVRPFVIVSESMQPEVPKNSLVLLDTHARFEDVEEGENIAYIQGQIEVLHKVTEVKEQEITVRPLSGNGKSVVKRDAFLGKEILSIPGIGDWTRRALQQRIIMIIAAAGLVIVGCVLMGKKREEVAVDETKN